MQIESIKIQNLRSLENVDINNFGSFNAFVGKNNSGKSTVLLAIETFLSLIQTGGIIYYPISIGNKKDFFMENCNTPISITANIKIDDDLGTILKNILKHETQGKTSLPEKSFLQLTILILNKRQTGEKGFGYLNDVRVTTSPPNLESLSEIIFLNFDYSGAVELQIRQNGINEKIFDLKYLSELDDKRLKKIIKSNAKQRKFLPILVEGKRKEKIKVELSKGMQIQLTSFVEKNRDFSIVRERINELQKYLEYEITRSAQAQFSSDIVTVTGKSNIVPKYIAKILNYFSNKKIIHLKESRPTISENESQKILALKIRRDKKRPLLDIQRIISELLGVEIDAFEDIISLTKNQKKAELDIDGISAELSGYGIKEVLRIILDIELLNPDILLIDEPEVHLHPGLEVNLMKYLIKKSETCQIFISTHSTNFLDLYGKKNIYLVNKTRSSNVKQIYSENEVLMIPEELGIRLSSFFIYDRLVFVEGTSDIEIITKWALKLGKNLAKNNIGFISMSGKKNIRYYAADKMLSFLSQRQIKMWFLLDRDEMVDSDIDEIKKKLGDNASFFPLKKREIENYLICPRALFEFLKLKNNKANSKISQKSFTIESVEESLNRCCEELKPNVIDKKVAKKLCNPIYLIRKGDKINKEQMRGKFSDAIEKLRENKRMIESSYEESSDIIDSIWESEKINLVQGDELLSCVCKEYGVHFKKVIHGPELADLMNCDEIDNEIVEFIEEIIQ